MIAEDLQAIRERVSTATPGPWKFNGNEVVAVSSPLVGIAGATSDEDSGFIAAARQDVPTLCNEVERLTTENTFHSTQLDRAREEIGRLRGALEWQRDRCTTCVGTGLTLQRSHNDTSKPYLAEMECPDCKHVRLALAGDSK